MEKEKKTEEKELECPTAAEVLVKCLENEGVEYIFGILPEISLPI